jgi:hypothetical protein
MAHKVVYERSGEPAQVVHVVESDEPQAPQRGQVLVRVTAFSVHPGNLAGLGRLLDLLARLRRQQQGIGAAEAVGVSAELNALSAAPDPAAGSSRSAGLWPLKSDRLTNLG